MGGTYIGVNLQKYKYVQPYQLLFCHRNALYSQHLSFGL